MAEAVAVERPDAVVCTGDLTIRGQTKRITIPARLNFYDPQNQMGRVTGEFVIDRSEFGVSYNSTVNPIENEVKVLA